jgi:uncharacterized membrane protein YebE (DUF533 family)
MDWQGIIKELLGPGVAPQGGAPLPGRPGQGGGLAELLGGSAGGGGTLGALLQRIRPPMGQAAGAAAAGGLLGSVMGGRGGGGLLRMGGMALVGLLAHRAYEGWKTQQGGGTAPDTQEFARPEADAAGGRPFGLVLVQAMMAAARADGTMDDAERERIFAEAERLDLDAEGKAEMFRIIDTPADPEAVARLAETDAQKAELYTASALVIGEPGAAERAYLDALAGALDLPPGLKLRLDGELREAAALRGRG